MATTPCFMPQILSVHIPVAKALKSQKAKDATRNRFLLQLAGHGCRRQNRNRDRRKNAQTRFRMDSDVLLESEQAQ